MGLKKRSIKYIYIMNRYITIILNTKKIHKTKLLVTLISKTNMGDFPGGAVVKNPPANAGDTSSSPGPGRSHMPQSN